MPRFLALLTLIFITLKLTHVIDWSWWWVLLPAVAGAAIQFAAVWLVTWLKLKAQTRR